MFYKYIFVLSLLFSGISSLQSTSFDTKELEDITPRKRIKQIEADILEVVDDNPAKKESVSRLLSNYKRWIDRERVSNEERMLVGASGIVTGLAASNAIMSISNYYDMDLLGDDFDSQARGFLSIAGIGLATTAGALIGSCFPRQTRMFFAYSKAIFFATWVTLDYFKDK